MNTENKKSLRQSLLSKRIAISKQDFAAKSHSLSENLKSIIEENDFKFVFIFEPFRNEPDIRPLVHSLFHKYEFSLPRISSVDGEMEFFPWDDNTKFIVNKFGISEPSPDGLDPSLPDNDSIIVIPCLAADDSGIRLGYGGGYYDRFLNAFPNTLKVGVLFDEFLLDSLPCDSWDQELDIICTDQRLLKIRL